MAQNTNMGGLSTKALLNMSKEELYKISRDPQARVKAAKNLQKSVNSSMQSLSVFYNEERKKQEKRDAKRQSQGKPNENFIDRYRRTKETDGYIDYSFKPEDNPLGLVQKYITNSPYRYYDSKRVEVRKHYIKDPADLSEDKNLTHKTKTLSKYYVFPSEEEYNEYNKNKSLKYAKKYGSLLHKDKESGLYYVKKSGKVYKFSIEGNIEDNVESLKDYKIAKLQTQEKYYLYKGRKLYFDFDNGKYYYKNMVKQTPNFYKKDNLQSSSDYYQMFIEAIKYLNSDFSSVTGIKKQDKLRRDKLYEFWKNVMGDVPDYKKDYLTREDAIKIGKVLQLYRQQGLIPEKSDFSVYKDGLQDIIGHKAQAIIKKITISVTDDAGITRDRIGYVNTLTGEIGTNALDVYLKSLHNYLEAQSATKKAEALMIKRKKREDSINLKNILIDKPHLDL